MPVILFLVFRPGMLAGCMGLPEFSGVQSVFFMVCLMSELIVKYYRLHVQIDRSSYEIFRNVA